MVQKVRTLFRHWLAPGRRRVLSDEALERLTAHVAASETRHSGEIRICVEPRLPDAVLLQPLPMAQRVRQRAEDTFARLRVWDTAHNNGVLIYLLLAERAIEVVADRGIHARVPQAQWDALVQQLGAALAAGQFEQGLVAAVDRVSDLLAQHFALAPGEANPNELPDAPATP